MIRRQELGINHTVTPGTNLTSKGSLHIILGWKVPFSLETNDLYCLIVTGTTKGSCLKVKRPLLHLAISCLSDLRELTLPESSLMTSIRTESMWAHYRAFLLPYLVNVSHKVFHRANMKTLRHVRLVGFRGLWAKKVVIRKNACLEIIHLVDSYTTELVTLPGIRATAAYSSLAGPWSVGQYSLTMPNYLARSRKAIALLNLRDTVVIPKTGKPTTIMRYTGNCAFLLAKGRLSKNKRIMKVPKGKSAPLYRKNGGEQNFSGMTKYVFLSR